MFVEIGDYFAVVRGFELFCDPEETLDLLACLEKSKTDTSVIVKPRYDRSFDGCILKVLSCAFPMVAAEIVKVGSSYTLKKGQKLMLNTSEIEIMTLSKDFVKAMQIE